MKKASEYRLHAQECRALAVGAGSEEHRNQLIEMAQTWEDLAGEREKLVANLKRAETAETTVAQRLAPEIFASPSKSQPADPQA